MTVPCQSRLPFLALLTILLGAIPCAGQERVLLKEHTGAGSLYRISTRVELNGSLTLPAEKGQAGGQEKLHISGKSAIDYDERVLELDKAGKVNKTVRVYQQMSFERKVGEQLQKVTLRPDAKRMVILRQKQVEVPFSPDTALTWGEIDLVRTDVFTPALLNLLPTGQVEPGDRWSAATTAVVELTDFAELEQGGLACKLEQFITVAGQKHARVSFQGTVQGTSEDGTSRQDIDGHLYFNLHGNYLSYLTMKGTQFLLDENGKAVGKLEGSFVLTRQPLTSAAGLGNADLAKLTLEPTRNNTLLLHDDPLLGIRFLYPRRWHVAGGKGRQLGLDEKGGSGILLTVEPVDQLPTGHQFLKESQAWLKKQDATVLGVTPVKVMQQFPSHVEHFALDVSSGKQKFRMYYLVVRQSNGGVVVAARLQPNDLANLQDDVIQVVTSIQITKKQ